MLPSSPCSTSGLFSFQEASCKNHRVNRVVFLGNMKRLLTTGVSRWNTRQIALWDQVRSHPLPSRGHAGEALAQDTVLCSVQT